MDVATRNRDMVKTLWPKPSLRQRPYTPTRGPVFSAEPGRKGQVIAGMLKELYKLDEQAVADLQKRWRLTFSECPPGIYDGPEPLVYPDMQLDVWDALEQHAPEGLTFRELVYRVKRDTVSWGWYPVNEAGVGGEE